MAQPSRGEIKIREILDMAGLKYKTECEFPDLLTSSKRGLRFDFVVYDDDDNIDFIIEYQGIQHYEPVDRFGGKKGLFRQKYNDNQKRIYCAKKDIPLIAIPYWDEPQVDLDYILTRAGY
ncbi:MAG: hypothetical protein HUJ68_11905 [Clostridia bacterium]|nr:hypothetical protein [Clostridia bacterium]